eukprot:403346077
MGTSKANSAMIMTTNSFPYTYKPLFDFFPQGLYKKAVSQKIYPKALLEPGVLKYTIEWLKANKPFEDQIKMDRLNQLNNQLIKDIIAPNGDINPSDVEYEEKGNYANIYNLPSSKVANFRENQVKKFILKEFYEFQDVQEKIQSEHPEVNGIDEFNLCLYEPLGRLDSYKMSNALYKYLKKQSNFESYMGYELESFNHDKKKYIESLTIQQAASHKTIEGDEFYICTGPQTPVLFANKLNKTIPIVPIKGYSFEFKMKSVQRHTHLKWPQLGVVASYMGNDIIRFSGFGDIAGSDYQIDRKRMDYLKSIAAKFYGDDVIYNHSFNEWCGLRPCTPDDMPLVGLLRPFKNLLMNTGHGGRGITQGFATSKILADWNTQKGLDEDFANNYLKPFSPDRFNQ